MNTANPTERRGVPMRAVRVLAGSYLAISAVTLVAIVLMRDNTAMVNSAVWIRGTLVVASALLTLLFTARAAAGSRRAFLRLRIVSAVTVVAIVLVVALPDPFPLWLKIEQVACGLVLIGVVVQVNGPRLRSAFAGR
ncbi:MAG TPA: hypothetical protein VJX10_16025 [Pseudonocardiaceae bacterium]|nr:hypothetical protein [Pseudonocardiaceae bacterium]